MRTRAMDKKKAVSSLAARTVNKKAAPAYKKENKSVVVDPAGNPVVGGEFKGDEIAKAHKYVEERKSIGKIIVNW